jgi:hypothetical protein
MSNTNVTLITMGQGNINALRRTMESMSVLCNEVVFGDLMIFPEDREAVYQLKKDFNIKVRHFPFNYIFENGFACILNQLSKHATNDLVIYMNVGEVVDKNLNLDLISPSYNSYSFNHSTDPHTWIRMYNRKELWWTGMIHEQVMGPFRVCPTHLFMMADTEKDMEDPFKAKVFNDIKEMCYWNQYLRLIDRPDLIGFTGIGWVTHAKEAYESYTDRMRRKGNRLKAFQLGDLDIYLNDINSSKEFEEERAESTKLINLQGKRLDVL